MVGIHTNLNGDIFCLIIFSFVDSTHKFTAIYNLKHGTVYN